MKKTNVMIEVSDDLYSEIVEPYKKKKGFGKLVVQLLEAYRTNDSIYSYINGAMDELETEATEELLKDLNNMAQSLNMMGVLHNQAEVVIDEGQRAFDEFGESAYKDSAKYGGATSSSKEKEVMLTKEDVVEIVNESVSDIKSMLENLLKQKEVPSTSITEERVEQVKEVVESKINTSLSEVINESNAPKEVVNHVVENKPSREDEAKAGFALSSLLDSATY